MDFDEASSLYREAHKKNITCTGEDPEYFHAMKARIVAGALKPEMRPGLRVLDYGCGLGLVTRQLKKLLPDADVHGADPSIKSVEIAAGETRGISFRHFDGKAAPYGENSFDAVLLSCVLHHVPEGRQAVYADIHRVLAPGKRLFIFEHNPLNPLTRRAVNTCVFDEGAVLIGRRACVKELQEAGFSIVETRYIVFFPGFLKKLRPLEDVLGWLPLGGQYVICAAKEEHKK
ncbi:MAG: class I SAM-dependent methyltransferase [Actinomycetota bacterium]|nr:class I SAM-dependent methyltransferase [Actinomycetota bacterium]